MPARGRALKPESHFKRARSFVFKLFNGCQVKQLGLVESEKRFRIFSESEKRFRIYERVVRTHWLQEVLGLSEVL